MITVFSIQNIVDASVSIDNIGEKEVCQSVRSCGECINKYKQDVSRSVLRSSSE